jgi:hypothetical protein
MNDEPMWEQVTPDVLAMAERVINQYHEILTMFDGGLNIVFVFRKEAQKAKGRSILGSVMKVPDKFKLFLDADFMIWLSKADWEGMRIEEREGLLDHELTHIQYPKGVYTLVGHDFEEFYEVIARRGFWDERLRRIDRELATYQESLFGKTESELFAAAPKLSTINQEQAQAMNGTTN